MTDRPAPERIGLRLEEAAKQLGVHPDTLRSWLRAGEFPGRRVGRTWLVSPIAVADFLGGYDDRRAQPQRGQPVLPEAGRAVGREGVDAGRLPSQRVTPRQGRGKATARGADPAPGRGRKAKRSPRDGWDVSDRMAS